jgi:hypothetical protein
MSLVMKNFLLTIILCTLLVGCGSMGWIAPSGSLTYDKQIPATKPIPLFMLGESPDHPYKSIGHVFLSFKTGADTLPLNYVGEVTPESGQALIDIARKIGADPIIRVS